MPVLSARGLRKSVGRGRGARLVLDGADLDVERGELVAVLGRSGSGKSTLLHLLGGLDRPDAGSIEIAGRPLERADERSLARIRLRSVGFVFQSFALVEELSGEDNVLLPTRLPGAPRGGRGRARRLIDELGVGAVAARTPHELSGGERQRFAIARALVNDPDLVLADEPTGNLDATAALDVLELLRGLTARGCGVVVVTHERDTTAAADRVLRLVDGRLEGTDVGAGAPVGGVSGLWRDAAAGLRAPAPPRRARCARRRARDGDARDQRRRRLRARRPASRAAPTPPGWPTSSPASRRSRRAASPRASRAPRCRRRQLPPRGDERRHRRQRPQRAQRVVDVLGRRPARLRAARGPRTGGASRRDPRRAGPRALVGPAARLDALRRRPRRPARRRHHREPDDVAYPLAAPRDLPLARRARRPLRAPADRDPAVEEVELWTRDAGDLDALLVQARESSYGIHDLRFVTRDGVRVLIDQAAGIVIALLVALSVVALLTAAVMLAASARAEVQRRLRSIGVLRAVGATRGRVAALAAAEAALVAAPAAAVGALAGLLVAAARATALLDLLNERPPGSGAVAAARRLLADRGGDPGGGVGVAGVARGGRPPVALLAGAELAAGARRGRGAAGLAALGGRLVAARRTRLLATLTVLGVSAAFILLMLALAAQLNALENDPAALGKRYQLLASLPAADAAARRGAARRRRRRAPLRADAPPTRSRSARRST